MKRYFLLLSLIGIICFTAAENDITATTENSNSDVEEDAVLNVPQIIEKYGYPVEIHHAVSSDDYILEMHRIPNGVRATQKKEAIVYLQHGMLLSSSCYVLGGPQKGLAYILADAGYDVWIGNARGNRYSRNHTKLDPNFDEEFWDFSWHEIGVYDIPAMIDHILCETGKDELFYVGHSQGTTALYVMTSTLPEYNDKLIATFSMAPVGYMNHLVSPLVRAIAVWQQPVGELFDIIGLDEFLPNSKFYTIAGELFCEKDEITAPLCTNAAFILSGFDPKEINATLVPVYLGHFPAGTSTKTILHYGQEIDSGHFRQFDEGLLGNILRYGKLSPPNYDLEEITAPMYLFYSRNDWFSSEVDVLRLDKRLKNSELILVEDRLFNHLDYLFGIHAPEYVYDKIINIMETYLVQQ